MRLLPILLGITCITTVRAQEKSALVTDRPDMTESTVAVGPGMVQVESGYHYESDEVSGIK